MREGDSKRQAGCGVASRKEREDCKLDVCYSIPACREVGGVNRWSVHIYILR